MNEKFVKIEALAEATKNMASAIMEIDFEKASTVLDMVDDTEFFSALEIIRQVIIPPAKESVEESVITETETTTACEPIEEETATENAEFYIPTDFVPVELPEYGCTIHINKDGIILYNEMYTSKYEFDSSGNAIFYVTERKSIKVDVLMVHAFIGMDTYERMVHKCGCILKHIDGNRANCRLKNLEFVPKGSCEKPKLTYHEVDKICELLIKHKFDRGKVFSDLHYLYNIHGISTKSMEKIVHRNVPAYEDVINKWFDRFGSNRKEVEENVSKRRIH